MGTCSVDWRVVCLGSVPSIMALRTCVSLAKLPFRDPQTPTQHCALGAPPSGQQTSQKPRCCAFTSQCQESQKERRGGSNWNMELNLEGSR